MGGHTPQKRHARVVAWMFTLKNDSYSRCFFLSVGIDKEILPAPMLKKKKKNEGCCCGCLLGWISVPGLHAGGYKQVLFLL